MRMILLTGGSGCGKSYCAEALLEKLPMPHYYITAMRPSGEEDASTMERHRRIRQSREIETIAGYTDLNSLLLPRRGTALLECICNLTANEMFHDSGDWVDPYDPVVRGIETLLAQCDHLIVVTNEVGSDGNCYDAGTRAYIEALGRINETLAKRADDVYELVCGIPVVRKGALL